MDEPALDVKVIRTYGPTCDTGRHYPPHPGDTCDDVDHWIRWRNQLLTDFFAREYARVLAATDAASLAGTAFAACLADPIPQPEQASIEKAMDILAPHLAWQPRYRPEERR